MQSQTVGVLADAGLPEKVARSLTDGLSQRLAAHPATDGQVRWEVEVSRQSLPLTAQGAIPLLDHAQRLRQEHGWDCVVYLTDLPRSHEGDPMLCEASATAGAVLVSLPALGAVGLRAKTCQLLTTLIKVVGTSTEEVPAAAAVRDVLAGAAVRRAPSDETGDRFYIVLTGWPDQLRLLAGMVRSNRPGRLLPALSGAVAAAVATGAFGIFYAAIWNMSDALSPARLAAISGVVITALSGWLIYHNGLWDTTHNATDPWRAGRDNASTVITVWLSVAMMYLLLWSMLFLVALAVIAAGYLQSQLGHPVNLFDYGHLSWLAASLGTLAGALGSNFDSDEAIREATYSRREHQRRKLADAYKE